MSSNKKEGVLKYATIAIVFLALYLLAAKIGLSLAFFNKSASPMWPPAGIAVAALIILGYKYWPSVFVGAFIINFIATPQVPVSLGIALGNTLEAFLGAYLINRFAGNRVFENIKNTRRFFIIGFIAPLASSIIGVVSLASGGFLSPGTSMLVWFTWWIGDVVGILFFVPIIIVFHSGPMVPIEKDRYLELFLSFLVVVLLSAILFFGWPIGFPREIHLVYLALPILLIIALRFCVRVAMVATFVMSSFAVLGTVVEKALFNVGAINSALIFVQLFVIVTIISILSLSVILTSYKKALRK